MQEPDKISFNKLHLWNFEKKYVEGTNFCPDKKNRQKILEHLTKMYNFSWPNFSWPNFSWPNFSWPNFSSTNFTWPNFYWPDFPLTNFSWTKNMKKKPSSSII